MSKLTLKKSTFKKIHGHSFAKKKLHEIVPIVQNRDKSIEKYMPKGVLLHGPIGVGKRALAHAFMQEIGFECFVLDMDDVLSLEEIDRVFLLAKNRTPSVLYIEGIDKMFIESNNAFLDKCLDHIDEIESNYDKRVFLVTTATSLSDIPSSLIDSGRIDIHLPLYSLDKEARRYFLNSFLEDIYFEPNIDIENVLRYTTGMNGADLKRLQRESVLYILRNGIAYVNEQILIEQANTITHGHRVALGDEELKESAYHEAAHAVISKVLLPLRKIEQISVISREHQNGMISYDDECSVDLHVDSVKAMIVVALAGRVAQVKVFGNQGIDTTARDDLKLASRLAYKAVSQWGMDEELGCFALDESLPKDFCQSKIETAVLSWLEEAKKEAIILVDKQWGQIEKVANALIKHEEISEKTLLEIIK